MKTTDRTPVITVTRRSGEIHRDARQTTKYVSNMKTSKKRTFKKIDDFRHFVYLRLIENSSTGRPFFDFSTVDVVTIDEDGRLSKYLIDRYGGIKRLYKNRGVNHVEAYPHKVLPTDIRYIANILEHHMAMVVANNELELENILSLTINFVGDTDAGDPLINLELD